MADEKIRQQNNNFPIEITPKKSIAFFGRTKSEIDFLKKENMTLKNQVIKESQKDNINFVKITKEQEAIDMFRTKVHSIARITREQLLQNQKCEPGAMETTLELW